MSGQVSDAVKKCCAILQNATSDTERFAALFMVTKLIKGKDFNLAAKKLLFKAIGFDFLKRLLLTSDVPIDCPPSIYKSLALSVLTVFCAEEELVALPELQETIPIFLEIVKHSDNSDYDDNLMAVGEAYNCLKGIASCRAGQDALIASNGIAKMREIYVQGSFQSDEALQVLVLLISRNGPKSWEKVDDFHTFMNKLAVDFESDHDKRKFELCEILNGLLFNCPRKGLGDCFSTQVWAYSLHKGLSDILQSKIGAQQRNPALILAASAVDVLGVEWVIQEEEKSKQFFLLLIQLAAVEIRMQLEGKSLKAANTHSRLICACYIILELSMTYIATDQLDLDQKEKQTLYSGLKGAFTAVTNLLLKVSNDKNKPEGEEKLFVCATIRVLASWLAQETSAMKTQVYQILPFVLDLANETFYAHRARRVAEKAGDNNEALGNPLGQVDVLRVLMPALCHLAVEDVPRKLMLKKNQEQILLEFIEFHWTIVHYKRPPVPRSERLKVLAQPKLELSPELLEDMKDSRAAMISTCNVFMNLTVLEGKYVEESTVFGNLMRFIFENLPELKDIPENLVLHGNLAVLGLLLLKQLSNKVKKNDFSICRYIQATIRFLWDAYTIDKSNDPTSLVVAMSYKESWMELAELWFLGMQTMSGVISVIPWISEFAIESGWAEGIVKLLSEVKLGTLPPNVKAAFEDFLCHLVDANPDVSAVLKQAEGLKVCRNHRLMELGKKLFGD